MGEGHDGRERDVTEQYQAPHLHSPQPPVHVLHQQHAAQNVEETSGLQHDLQHLQIRPATNSTSGDVPDNSASTSTAAVDQSPGTALPEQHAKQPDIADTISEPGPSGPGSDVVFAQAAAAQMTAQTEVPGEAAEHPFETEPGDHAETPLEAYQHIAPLLSRLAKRLGTTDTELRIYDPFFCEGRMARHMASLGFHSVYNRNEDFYAVQAAKAGPEFDVLVTNPPFSGDHIERIFRFMVASRKPWFLLVPQYVARKAFYLEWLGARRPGTCRPMCLGPSRQPYVFTAPDRADVRQMRVKQPELATSASVGEGSGCQEAVTAAAASPSGAGSHVQRQQSVTSVTSLGVGAQGEEPWSASHGGKAQVSNDAETADPVQVVGSGGAAGNSESAGIPGRAGARSPAGSAGPDGMSASAELAGSPGSAGPDGMSASAQRAGSPRSAGPDGGPFQVAAGSFQCVWFFSLGETHQKPVVEWWRKTYAEAAGCAIAANVGDLPQLMAAQKLTPAERRWRKKQQQLGLGLGQEVQQGEGVGGAVAELPTAEGSLSSGWTRPGSDGKGGRRADGRPGSAAQPGSGQQGPQQQAQQQQQQRRGVAVSQGRTAAGTRVGGGSATAAGSRAAGPGVSPGAGRPIGPRGARQ